MTTDGPYISKTFESASPRGRKEVVSTVDRGVPTVIVDENRHSGLRRLKSRSWGSVRRWEKENELLFAMIEDESEWLAELFPDEIIAPEFFFFALEDGVLLCKLANLIQEYAEKYGKENNIEIPKCHLKYHPRSKTRGQLGQFRARENVTAFLGWCRKHQLPEVILFESNDVVQTEDLREGAREVVICLMEVARRSYKYGVKPPKLIILEKEIDEEERTDSLGSPNSIDSGVDTEINSRTKHDANLIDPETRNSIDNSNHVEIKNALNSIDNWKDKPSSNVESGENQRVNNVYDVIDTKGNNDQTDSRQKPQSELDRKVFSLLEEYSVDKILRLKEGKYIILGRVMFVRMLNDHVLVRIGGGWDGLEHYLMTHVKQGSQSQNPQSTPSANVIRSTAPNTRADARRNNKPLSPAASSNSLVEGKKDEFRAFTPPLQSSLVARGRESPLRKISRAKDTDEADIARAIRRIENTVSENIQRKTSSNSALELATSDSGQIYINSRKPGPKKMATPEIEDFSSIINENGGFQRQENDVGSLPSQEIIEDKPELLDEDNKKGIENEVPVINGDLDAEHHTKHLMNDVEKFETSENCMNVVVTKKETGQQIAGEKKSQGTGKKQTDAKGTKPQSKTNSSVKSTTTTTKTQSKVDKKVASAAKKPTTKSTTSSSTTKPLPKSATEKKTGSAGKTPPAKPIFKVSTSTSSTISELRSLPSKGKPAPTSSKSAATKPATAKATATMVNGKKPSGKPMPKASATAKQVSAKSDGKGKKEVKKELDGKKTANEDSTDGAALSTKAKVNDGSKVAAQTKSKSGGQTPKVSAPAKSTTAAKAKSAKASGKVGSGSGVDKSKEKAFGVSTAKTGSIDKASSKTTPAHKAEKSDSTVKQSAADGRSKKATTSNASKVASSSAKGGESGKKPAASSKPTSAPPKTSCAAKSTKPPAKQSPAPPKSAPATLKAAKSAAKPSPSTTASSVEKKAATPKSKATRTALDRADKVTPSKASVAKNNKEVKTSKTPSDKSTKVEKKDSKKPLKVSADKKKEPKKDTAEKPVSKETVIVEHKEKATVDVVLPAFENDVEECTTNVSEADVTKSSTEATILEPVNAEYDLGAKSESRELTTTEEVLLNTDSEPSGLDSQIADIGLQQRDDSSMPNVEGIEISNEFSEVKDIEVKSETESRLEQFNIQLEVKEQSFEDDSSCKEDKGVVEQMELTDDLSSQNIAEQSPSQIEMKGIEEEGRAKHPPEINSSDLSEGDRQEQIEYGREEISCEEEEDATTKDDIEEQDRESAMFDETKLISLEEITAKCDEDDIREGAVAPTPPETPVPDNASAETSAVLEMEYQSDMAPDLSSAAEQIPCETSFMISEVDDDPKAKGIEMHQANEVSSTVTGQDVAPEENLLVEELQKDDTVSETPDELQETEADYSGKEALDADNEVVAPNQLDDSQEYHMKEDEYSGQVTDLNVDNQDILHDDESETLKDDAIESNESAMFSQKIHDSATDSGEPLETQDFNVNQNNEADAMSNQIEAVNDVKIENADMDRDLSEDTEMGGESEMLIDDENLMDNELLERTEKPEDVEASSGYEVTKVSDVSEELDLITTQAPGLICGSEKELISDNVFESKQDESYYIGSKGTEELMQRETVEEENVGAAFHEADEPLPGEVGVKVELEAEDEEKEGENLEEEKDDFGNEANVESYGISVNEVTIDSNQVHDADIGSNPVDHDGNMPEDSVYDAVPVNSQVAKTEDMGATIGEQEYVDDYAAGSDVMIAADAAQNEILNPDIGLQENESEGEKTPNREEYEETKSSDEDEDVKDVTLKPLDLEEQIGDSTIAEDQFTPISDLPDDMRSPLTKDSFGQFADEECGYQDGSDGEGEEFVRDVIEHAKESVRVAKSLDDSCEEEKEEVKSQTLESEAAQQFDDNFEADDASKDEISSYEAPVPPQVISSPYISSDGEDFEEKEIQEDDTSNQMPVDTMPDINANHENHFQDSSTAVHQTGFPDAVTSDNLRDMYHFEAESYDHQLGYERQLYEDQVMGAQPTGEQPNVDVVGLKVDGSSMEQEEPVGDSYMEETEMQFGEQNLHDYHPQVGETENIPSGDGEEEVTDTTQEDQKHFDDASFHVFGKEGEIGDQESHEDGSNKEFGDDSSHDVMQTECHDQYTDGDERPDLEGDDRLEGADIRTQLEEGKQEGILADMEFDESERTDCYGMEKNVAESSDTWKERTDEVYGVFTTEQDRSDAQAPSFEDQVSSSQERSDVERNMQSDDQTTDGSDFVLLDSPVRQLGESKTDASTAESDTDMKDILQASLNESESEDSPFHHIELKPEEAKDEGDFDEKPPSEALSDLVGNEKVHDNHSVGEDIGTSYTDNQIFSSSSMMGEHAMDSFENKMEFPQSPNQLWKSDMQEEEKQFQNDGVLYQQNNESQVKFDNLVSESLNTGPRYVYDGSDDEDGVEDYDDDDDETY